MPLLGHEPEADCNWQPLDSRLDLNIDETETWQRGLCSTFWLASCYTDPFYCQINSVSGLQYVRAVRQCHSALGPTWNSSQSKLMAIQKLHETLPIKRGKKCNIKVNLIQSDLWPVLLLACKHCMYMGNVICTLYCWLKIKLIHEHLCCPSLQVFRWLGMSEQSSPLRSSTWVKPRRRNRLLLRAHPPVCGAMERARITERLIKEPRTDLGRPFERTSAVTQDDTLIRALAQTCTHSKLQKHYGFRVQVQQVQHNEGPTTQTHCTHMHVRNTLINAIERQTDRTSATVILWPLRSCLRSSQPCFISLESVITKMKDFFFLFFFPLRWWNTKLCILH